MANTTKKSTTTKTKATTAKSTAKSKKVEPIVEEEVTPVEVHEELPKVEEVAEETPIVEETVTVESEPVVEETTVVEEEKSIEPEPQIKEEKKVELEFEAPIEKEDLPDDIKVGECYIESLNKALPRRLSKYAAKIKTSNGCKVILRSSREKVYRIAYQYNLTKGFDRPKEV